jgi:ABC-type antimicrobial peptide transport system permease subunit
MGVRVALGASAGDVRRLVIGGGLRLAVAGGLIGLVGAAAVGRLLSALLFDVSPFEPGIYSAAFVVMMLAALASMMPAAQRAARVDATVALRTE